MELNNPLAALTALYYYDSPATVAGLSDIRSKSGR